MLLVSHVLVATQLRRNKHMAHHPWLAMSMHTVRGGSLLPGWVRDPPHHLQSPHPES